MNQPLPSGTVIAGYRLLRLLGEGEQSQVYLAEHRHSNEVAALKVADIGRGDEAERVREDFLRAAHAAQSLRHADIVAVWRAGTEGPLAWLAMEPVPGTDLARYTRPPRLLPEPAVLRLCARLAAALAYAHRKGVVHRDLKPQNILINWATDSLKLADFGLAHISGATRTATGIVLGTPSYMAPEQLAGEAPTAASDFYALGVVLFELLTGRRPHEATSLGELLRQVSQEPAPNLADIRPQLPAGVAQIVARLLAKAPAQRPAQGDTVAADLQALADGLSASGVKSR